MRSQGIRHDAIRLVAAWAVVFVALAAALLLLSDGEPVCEGPLILDVDDSFPPQCDGPWSGLVSMAAPLLLGSLVVAAIVRIVIVAAGMIRRRT